MKLKFVLIALAVLVYSRSFAQSANTTPSLSIGLEVGFPVSDNFSSLYNAGVGGSAKLAIPVVTNGSVTLSAGYISFSGNKFSGMRFPSLTLLPFKAGFRYRTPGNLYFEPQLGITSIKLKGANSSETSFTIAGNVGYIINNIVDLSARYEVMTKGSTRSFIGLRAAFILPL